MPSLSERVSSSRAVGSGRLAALVAANRLRRCRVDLARAEAVQDGKEVQEDMAASLSSAQLPAHVGGDRFSNAEALERTFLPRSFCAGPPVYLAMDGTAV